MTIPPSIPDVRLAERAPIDHASGAVGAANREAYRRFRAKYARRRLVRRIDDVLDLVERANMAGATTPPAAALALIEELGGLPPATALQAHDELFRCQRRHMRTTVYEGELADHEDGDQVVELVAAVEDDQAARLGLLSDLCAWLERTGQVQHRALPPQWQALLRARASDTLTVAYYDRRRRGGWRAYADWRRRLQELGA